MLVSGAADQAAGDAVGVTRQTVNGWRNHDPDFIAALNARRSDVWGGAVDRLRSLLPTALETLATALEEKRDWRAAVAVVQLAGLDRQDHGAGNLGPHSIGPVDPDAIVDQMIRSRRRNPDQELEDLLSGGSVTAAERRQIRAELSARLETSTLALSDTSSP